MYYSTKLEENNNIFKTMNNLIKLYNVVPEAKLIEDYLTKISTLLSKANITTLINFLNDYINVYKDKLKYKDQEKVESILINSLNTLKNPSMNINDNIELKCKLLIYVNELRNEKNKRICDPFLNEIKIDYYKIKKYICIFIDKNVSMNFLNLLIILNKKYINDSQFNKDKYNFEDDFFIICYYLKYKKIDTRSKEFIKKLIDDLDSIYIKFKIKKLNFKLLEMCYIDSILKSNNIFSKFLNKTIENTIKNLTEKDVENIYDNLKEEILKQIIFSFNHSYEIKNRVAKLFLSENSKINILFRL